MNTEMKQKWLEALRSGNYTQTGGSLRRTLTDSAGQQLYGHCCLGVLCDIVDPTKWESTEYGSHFYKDEEDNVPQWAGCLPYSMRKRLGIGDGQMDQLIQLNDVEKKDFDGIASWIEEKL